MDQHYPEELRYTKEHEWCRVEGNVATVGITWHAQDALGDIVFCELPKAGEHVNIGEPFGVVESVKAVSDLYAPISGKVAEVNDLIVEEPEGLNDDTYDDGWLIKVEIGDTAELEQLLSAADYIAFLEKSAE